VAPEEDWRLEAARTPVGWALAAVSASDAFQSLVEVREGR
jgi:hypothetical protein